MIYVVVLLALVYPWFVNRDNNKNAALILAFAVQSAIQPFLILGDANQNYIIILLINIFYAMYALYSGNNKYWAWLAYFTLGAASITLIELLLYNSSISNDQFEYVFNEFINVIMSITLIQAYLIIRATNGYRGDVRRFSINIQSYCGYRYRIARDKCMDWLAVQELSKWQD